MSGARVIFIEMNDECPGDFVEDLKESPKCDGTVVISCRDISGKDMYCSNEAYDIIRDRLIATGAPAKGIHYIATGNYHYLSRIFTSFIDERYDLVLFDHHTDMQQGAFGDMLSCGSWAGDVLERDENLNTLTVFGPPAFEIEGTEVSLELSGKNIQGRRFFGKAYEEGISEKDIPVYISFDKDILSESVFVTNWDQGDMTAEEMSEAIQKVTSDRKLLGADICGGISLNDHAWNEAAALKNKMIDIKLFEIFSEK